MGLSIGGRVHSGLFEINLSSGEVHKSGRKVGLQEQPFRVPPFCLSGRERSSVARICRTGCGRTTLT